MGEGEGEEGRRECGVEWGGYGEMYCRSGGDGSPSSGCMSLVEVLTVMFLFIEAASVDRPT
jgi:hypothetical protein